MRSNNEDPRRRRRARSCSRSSRSTSGPQAGEGLVEMARGICHTDAYTPTGSIQKGCSSILGHEGRYRPRNGIRGHQCARRPCDPAYTPEWPVSRAQRQNQPLHRNPRDVGNGVMPNGTSRFSYKGETILPLHGMPDLRTSPCPEIAVAKIRETRPNTSCYIGCGVTTRRRAVITPRRWSPARNVVVFGPAALALM